MDKYDHDKWLYVNDKDNDVRYILGTKGQNTLLCFGINPSTAEPDKLDNTLKSVERIALNNGYDSWIMMNVYPQRATNPSDMHGEIDEEIHFNNLKYIEELLEQTNITIWAAWGTLINKRAYLKSCLQDIVRLSDHAGVEWVNVGKRTKDGHPHHPLYLAQKSPIESFNIKEYIEQLKN